MTIPTPEGGTEAQQPEAGQQYTPPASQADLDRIIQDRVAREQKKFGDYEELKAKAGEFDAYKTASLTDQEKAVEAARLEGRTNAESEWSQRLLGAEIRAVAADLKFKSPADALQLFGDTSAIPIADGVVDSAAVKTRLEALATEKAYLIDVQDEAPRVATKPKPKPTTPSPDQKTETGKGRAAAALRQLGANLRAK